MRPYLNLDGDAGVTHYEIGHDYIDVLFRRSAKVYRYSYARAGQHHVERMKVLAQSGRELTTYINQNVHDLAD
jgi:hypothetical protein